MLVYRVQYKMDTRTSDDGITWGHSLTTLTEFCPLLTIPSWHWWRNSFNVICKDLHIIEIFSTTYLPCLVKVVKERSHIRRLMGSTDQADPSCFYFRISWILMERLWFYFFCPLHLLQGLRSLKNWLLQKLSINILDQKF